MYRKRIHDLLFEFRDLVFLIYKMNFPRTDGESGDLQIGFTRKGDLLTFDGNNDFTLPVGANNYVLTADSTQTAGLSWKPTGGGSVSGPISSTLNAIARYTDTSGKVIKKQRSNNNRR